VPVFLAKSIANLEKFVNSVWQLRRLKSFLFGIDVITRSQAVPIPEPAGMFLRGPGLAGKGGVGGEKSLRNI
jgi:hypothetical protein